MQKLLTYTMVFILLLTSCNSNPIFKSSPAVEMTYDELVQHLDCEKGQIGTTYKPKFSWDNITILSLQQGPGEYFGNEYLENETEIIFTTDETMANSMGIGVTLFDQYANSIKLSDARIFKCRGLNVFGCVLPCKSDIVNYRYVMIYGLHPDHPLLFEVPRLDGVKTPDYNIVYSDSHDVPTYLFDSPETYGTDSLKENLYVVTVSPQTTDAELRMAYYSITEQDDAALHSVSFCGIQDNSSGLLYPIADLYQAHPSFGPVLRRDKVS